MSKFNGLGSSSQRPQDSGAANDECKDSLLDVIESQIIPRLLNSQQLISSQSISADSPEFGEPVPEMLDFTACCLKGDVAGVNQIVDRLLDRGLKQDRIFMELITPAARHLGVLWEKDLCDFSDVTCGLAQMHQSPRASPMTQLTALVTGSSRGIGAAIKAALTDEFGRGAISSGQVKVLGLSIYLPLLAY